MREARHIDGVATINRLVINGEIEEAAQAAARLWPRLVVEHIDYHAIWDEGQPWLEFGRSWIEAADPLARPEIASWLVNASVADMGYLEVEGEAAVMLARAVWGRRLGSSWVFMGALFADGA